MSRREVVGRALLVLALASPARAAGDAAGTAAGSFLSIGTGTSVLSMAGATLASGRDLAAASWNVASLARVDALQFSLAHAPLPGGATQDWLAGGGPVGRAGTRWGVQALFHREGDIEGRDAANNPTGTLSMNDLALGASLAQPLGALVTAGVGAEWVHESLAGTTGSGVSFSAGIRADTGPIGVALAARHVGGEMRYPDAHYDLPQVLAAGVSWTGAARGLRLNADFEAPRHYYRSVRTGAEWLWRDRLALRAGYRLGLGAPTDATVSGPAFGIGSGLGTMWLDYAFLLDGGTSGGEHRVGLTFRPGLFALAGGARRERSAEVEPSSQRTVSAPVERPAPRVAPPPPAAAPAVTPAAASTPLKPPGRPTAIVVAPGETLASLAQRWNTTVTALMMWNDLVADRVTPGQRLKLPPATNR